MSFFLLVWPCHSSENKQLTLKTFLREGYFHAIFANGISVGNCQLNGV